MRGFTAKTIAETLAMVLIILLRRKSQYHCNASGVFLTFFHQMKGNVLPQDSLFILSEKANLYILLGRDKHGFLQG